VGIMYGSSVAAVHRFRENYANAYFASPGRGEPLGMWAIPSLSVLRVKRDALVKRVRSYAKHQNLLAYWLHDEPDCADYNARAVPIGERIGTNAQALVEKAELVRQLDPQRLHFLEIDNTFKPDNWRVYGPIADLPCTDPYAIADCINPKTLRYVVQSIDMLHAAAGPRPIQVTLQAFQNRRAGFQRLPEPGEERIMLHYALGCGARGINYFLWGTDRAVIGCENSTPLWEEMGRLNAEVRVAGRLLAMSQPVKGLIADSPEDLWVRTLLCADQALALMLVNERYECVEAGFKVTPLSDLVVRVDVPDWLPVRAAFEVRSSGLRALPFVREGKRVAVTVGELECARMAVLTADPDLLPRRFEKVITRPRAQRERAATVNRDGARARLAQDLNPPGLIGAWYLDGGDGIMMYDATHHGNDGLISGARWTTGRVGAALAFDGQDDYAEIRTAANLQS